MTADAESWSEEEDIYLNELMRSEVEGETLDAYIRRVSPRHPPPAHARPIIDLWQRTRTERVFACIELPPRHAKTTIGLHGLAWRVDKDPSLINGFATFGDDYAASRSRMCRTIARTGGVDISKEMANLHEWRTTWNGGLISRGYHGEWTGQGITGVGLIDDPYKDRAAAESSKIRENVWEFFTDVWWTRFEEKSSCIVQHTRWHDDDLIGRLLKGKFGGYKFERVRLPAICEDEDDLLGRQIGDALWPERIPRSELDRIEASIGPYSWASLFQQRPRPKGSDIFVDPERFELSTWKAPEGTRIVLCGDPAATEGTRADFSSAFVLAAHGYGEQMRVWVLHGWRGRVTVPVFARKLLDLSRRYWNAPVVVEAVAGFKSVPQIMREIAPKLRIIQAKLGGDKFMRAQALSAAWNDGRVLLPLDAERVPRVEVMRSESGSTDRIERLDILSGQATTWADELIAEAADFTGVSDEHDDQIDALSHGFNQLASKTPPTRRGAMPSLSPFG